MTGEKIAIVGSGLIGRSWAMLSAAAGYKVCLYDILEHQVTGALKDIESKLKALEEDGSLKGELSAAEQHKLISGQSFPCYNLFHYIIYEPNLNLYCLFLHAGSMSLEETVKGAYYIQECTPEVLHIKKAILQQLDAVVDDNVIIASSSSNMASSKFAGDLIHKSQVLVAHPVSQQ
jgi:L-gulonate 3-dehydrogenase